MISHRPPIQSVKESAIRIGSIEAILTVVPLLPDLTGKRFQSFPHVTSAQRMGFPTPEAPQLAASSKAGDRLFARPADLQNAFKARKVEDLADVRVQAADGQLAWEPLRDLEKHAQAGAADVVDLGQIDDHPLGGGVHLDVEDLLQFVGRDRVDPPVWDFRPVESPSGQYIAFCRCAVGETPSLWRMNAAGGEERLLTRGLKDSGADHPRWLPLSAG